MNNGDVLAELDRAVMQTRKAIHTGMIHNDAYAAGLLDGLHGFRRFVRSAQFARILRDNHKSTPTKENSPHADRP